MSQESKKPAGKLKICFCIEARELPWIGAINGYHCDHSRTTVTQKQYSKALVGDTGSQLGHITEVTWCDEAIQGKLVKLWPLTSNTV